MRKPMSKEEILKSIQHRSINDEIDAFMLGLDAPLEREIMRYVWYNNNVSNLQMLVINFVFNRSICTKITLERRLESLVKFNFLNRFEYRGTIFYEVIKEEIKPKQEELVDVEKIN
jgi:predicted transcriptional regulator